MSFWTYVHGTIEVTPMGRTQAEKTYILNTVLEHLPHVTGSEEDMNVYVLQKNGHNESSSCDEFGERTNNLIDSYGTRNRRRGWLRVQNEYIIVVDGSLRDRMFEQTFKEFINWLCRLSKRVIVKDVMVEVSGYNKSHLIRNDNDIYSDMFESPSWSPANQSGEPNWCEYLMWEGIDGWGYPRLLAYKYIKDEENDARVEAWVARNNE